MAALLLVALGARAQELTKPEPVDRTELHMKELKIQREQLDTDMFVVLKKIRMRREEALKRDQELKAMQAEIRRLQETLEKRLQEKYPELTNLVSQRDDLQEEYDIVRKQQLKLRTKKQKALKKKDPSGKE
jgi:chromosome segregation ATPase